MKIEYLPPHKREWSWDNMKVGPDERHACERGVERFLKAHPSGESSIYDAWIEYPGCKPLHEDVMWLQHSTEYVVFAAVVSTAHTLNRHTYVNCHIINDNYGALGTFIGCTFEEGVHVHSYAEVIE